VEARDSVSNREGWTERSTNVIEHKEKPMEEMKNELKKEIGVQWIKAKSGTTYLCPVAALQRLKSPTEDQLKLICVDESKNPQNE
jgi:hypothetical protein